MDATNKWPGETQREWGRPMHMTAEVSARAEALMRGEGYVAPRPLSMREAFAALYRIARRDKLAGAALLVTAGTYAAFPHAFVFFGILHSIALASLLGLAVIRLPAVGLLLLAALVVAVDRSVAQEALNPRWWAWIGLGTMQPPSVDLVPVFPWFASVLMGMAVAKLAGAGGLWSRLAAGQPSGIARWLAWPGRHSLVIYLLHQPVLIGGLWLFLWLRA